MAQTVVFPDAVAVVVGHLADRMATLDPTAAVHARVPSPRPARFIAVERIGGTRRSVVVDQAMIDIEAWAQRPQDAHDLAQLARAVVHSMAGSIVEGSMVYDIAEVAGPNHLPDPESGHERYTLTMQIAVRGTAT